METLATNPEKATLARFLIIEYPRDNHIENRRMTTYLRLSKSLINMHSLSDFRVRSHPGNEAEMSGLDKIMWSVCKYLIFSKPSNDSVGDTVKVIFDFTLFTATTFSAFSQIIKTQTELQILGLYTPSGPRNILKTLKELHNAQLFFPIVLALDRESFTPYPDHISIFPLFYSVDHRATIHQVLAQSFGKDQGNYMVAKADNVRWLSIYLIDSSDMPSISAVVYILF